MPIEKYLGVSVDVVVGMEDSNNSALDSLDRSNSRPHDPKAAKTP